MYMYVLTPDSIFVISFRCGIVVKCNSFWKMAKDLSTNQPPMDVLPAPSKRLLYRAMVLAGSASFEGNGKDTYWQLVSVPFSI